MHKISEDFSFKDLYRLINTNKKIVWGKFACDENIPVAFFWSYIKCELRELLDENIIRLALKNADGKLDCVVLVRKSDYDSEIFGLNVGKVELAIVDSKIAACRPVELLRFFDKIKDNAALFDLDVIFARIGLEQMATIQYLQNVGALFTDVLLNFYNNIKNGPKLMNLPRSVKVEQANGNDEQELIAISKKAFRVDQFHGDPRLDKSRSDELYARWLSNAFNQLSSRVLVVRKEGEILGFVLCRIKQMSDVYKYGVIDLIGVKEKYRNQGFGSVLVTKALEWFSSEGGKSVYVGTQATNYSAIRIYQHAGFRQVYAECDLHLWFDKKM